MISYCPFDCCIHNSEGKCNTTGIEFELVVIDELCLLDCSNFVKKEEREEL